MHTIIHQKLLSFYFFSMISLILSMCLWVNVSFADEGFPGRKLYNNVQTVSVEQLHEKIANDKVVVVDVRSEYEHQTLSILNAVNIPLAKKSFLAKLTELRNTTTKDIVFYCNGRRCYTSFRANVKAIKANIKDCYTFDAGIFDWALAYPDQAVLLGETPVDKNRIISKNNFKAHQLSPQEFGEKSLAENAIIYDLRDHRQRRSGSGLFMFRDRYLGLDNIKKLERIILKAVENNTTLFFYDQKGKQIRWLQYSLESQGLKNYYFMKGGAGAYYAMLLQEQE